MVVYTEQTSGRVMGHALKHPLKDPETGRMLSPGPVTLMLKLEDDLGHESRAEIVVPRGLSHRYPVGAIVSVHLQIKQLEIAFTNREYEADAADTLERRRASGIETEFEIADPQPASAGS